MLRGIQEILGTGFPIAGGSAGDDLAFTKTYQFYNDKILTDSTVGALFGGSIAIGIGAKQGWKPLGKPRTITGARSNAIATIDNQPAVSMYESYFGTDMRDLEPGGIGRLTTRYPVGIAWHLPKNYLVRTALRILDDGSLLCNAESPEGSEIHLMMATQNTIIEAAREAAQEAKEQLGAAKTLCAIVLESVGRQQLLGLKAADALHNIQEIIGMDTPLAGFYTYGEQFPLHHHAEESVCFQNQSIVVILLGEP